MLERVCDTLLACIMQRRMCQRDRLCRYLAQHRYNVSLPELLDQVASPLVKRSLEEWTYRDVDSWPTPLDYLHMLGTGAPASGPSLLQGSGWTERPAKP